MRRMGLAGVVLAVVFMTMIGNAPASTLCLQLKANGTLKGPTTVGGNACKAGYEKIELPPAAQLETLNKVLPHMKYEEKGVAGKPTIQFSGVNVQVVSGAGKTNAAVNGEGNLVVGYDEHPVKHEQTGSHDLILGEEQEFTSYGGILAGYRNTVSGPYASVTGGQFNIASGEYASVSGGSSNKASGGLNASVSGGGGNTATASASSISGGFNNTASANWTSVGGGANNKASFLLASVTGGFENTASGEYASVSGGRGNTASGNYSSIFGSKSLKATLEYEAIP